MNISELYGLFKWLNEYALPVQSGYEVLGGILQHNATQPQKKPVSEQLEMLTNELENMPLEQLTNGQTSLLRYLDIERLLGPAGAIHVNKAIVRSDFDPATAAKEIRGDGQALSTAISRLDQVGSSLENLDFLSEFGNNENGRITVRIQFKEQASISDVTEWKKWSNEWHEIVRGVALCVDERPEDTQVIGASKGSLIMILSGTIGFVAALALITKHLSFIVKEGLVISNAIEDLRHKRILNKTIEKSLNDQKMKISKTGVKQIVMETKKALPNKINGEQEAALTKAVEKFLNFNELGGDIDFVSPAEVEADEDGKLPVSAPEIAEIRETVEQIRSTRAEVKLLTQKDEKIDPQD